MAAPSCSSQQWRLLAGMIYDHIRHPPVPGLLKVGWVSLQSLCRLFSTVCVNHKFWTTRSAVILLWGFVPFASFDWHLCDLATTGACTCSHHSNNPLESSGKKRAKCQGSSAGSTRREMDRQSSTFIPDSPKQLIHYSCSHRRFLQVLTDS